jgi:hypothetical protein
VIKPRVGPNIKHRSLLLRQFCHAGNTALTSTFSTKIEYLGSVLGHLIFMDTGMKHSDPGILGPVAR